MVVYWNKSTIVLGNKLRYRGTLFWLRLRRAGYMVYRYNICFIACIVTFVFCQTIFSNSTNSRISNIKASGPAHGRILSDLGSPSSNALVVSNIAPCAIAASSGGGTGDFGPEMMNDGREKGDCSYHWIRTQDALGRKKNAWVRLDWNEKVTVTNMTIQTTECNGSCGDDSKDPLYIDSGRNLGVGSVQYVGKDGITWISDGEFVNKTGDIEYSFRKPVTTKAIRIRKISPSTQCKGQQSNPVVFEWKVYGTPACK